jgi:glucose-6-phosphate 1-epimerase
MTAEAPAAPGRGEGGLPRVVLSSPGGGHAEVYLHGAHVARWTPPSGADVLYLSPRSRWAAGEAIRGGVPVIFPQFAGQGPLPKHGFARTTAWTLAESSATHALLVLTDTPETRKLWDHAFRAELRVELGDALAMTFAVENTGDRLFDFTCALHSYFRVADVTRAEVRGLDAVRFYDKVTGERHVQLGDRLRFGRETDRVYVRTPDELCVRDPVEERTVMIRKHGFPDAVVWNPGAAKAREISDLGERAYPRFVCVEAACAAEPVRLEPGGRWEGGQVIRVESAKRPGRSAAPR